MKTAKEWIASVKDPVIKMYLEGKLRQIPSSELKKNYKEFNILVDEIDWDDTPQGFKFWHEVYKSNDPTLSYSDFKHLDKSVETQTMAANADEKLIQLIREATFFIEDKNDNTWDVIDPENCESIALKYNAIKSVEQPKVSVNEDAVDFKEWTYKTRKVIFSDNKGILIWHDEGTNKRFTTTELYQNYLEDKHK
jgi:hypothetical protein